MLLKPPLNDVQMPFSYFTHNNWPKLKVWMCLMGLLEE